jgi:hypothetical protein
MKNVMAWIAAAFIAAGLILRFVHKNKPSVNNGWYALSIGAALACLAISYAMDPDWWRTAGFGSVSLVCFIAGIVMLKTGRQ